MPKNHQEFVGSLDQLANRWSNVDSAVLLKAFPLLARGRAVSCEALARASDVTVADVKRALRTAPVGVTDNGEIDELFGLMLAPAWHRIEVGDVALFGCCALLAHAAPMLLDRAVTVESVDPISRGLVRITIDRTGVTACSPAGAVATMPTPAEPGTRAGVRASFCSHIRHFVDPSTAAEFESRDRRRRTVGLPLLHVLAKRLVSRVWGV